MSGAADIAIGARLTRLPRRFVLALLGVLRKLQADALLLLLGLLLLRLLRLLGLLLLLILVRVRVLIVILVKQVVKRAA